MELYLPDIYQKSIYTIDYTKLLNKGIRCLLYDLDNTIVSKSTKVPPAKAKELFVSLKQKGFNVILFSNSPSIRLKGFKNVLGVEGISSARKPLPYKLKKLIKNYGYSKDEIAIIGDQLMTDVRVGNKVGITTILVNPISDKDFLVTKFNRFMEKKKIKELTSKNLFHKDRFYD